IGRAIRRSDFTEFRRQRIELRWAQAASGGEIVFVLHSANAVGDDQTSQFLWERKSIIQRNEPPSCRAKQMKAIDLQVFHQAMEVIGSCAWHRARLRNRTSPAAAIVGDKAKDRRCEGRNLMLPV